MEPHCFVHEYFPQQPPQYVRLVYRVALAQAQPCGACKADVALIHVLIRVGQAQAWPKSLPATTASWTEKLVDSLWGVGFDLVVKRKALEERPKAADEPFLRLLRWSKHDATLWLCPERSAANKVFVPSAWRVLAAQIFRWLFPRACSPILGRCAVVTGAPRVGKSVFLGFLLFQLFLLKSRHVCVIDVPGLTFTRLDRDGRTVDEGLRSVDIQRELRRPDTIYVFDAAASDDTKPLAATDIVARSIVVQRDCFEPRNTPRSRTFALPLWTAKEIRVFAKLFAVDRSDASFLSNKWGGVPGRIFARDVDASVKQLQHLLAAISETETTDALLQTKITKSWAETATGPSGHKWRSLVVVAGDAGNNFMVDGHVVFTSQFVCDELIQRLPLRTGSLRRLETSHQPKLWDQIRQSLTYSALEEEEKHETPIEIRQKNPPAPGG